MYGGVRKIRMRQSDAGWRALVFSLCAACLAATLLAQAGRRAHPTTEASSALNVVATRANGATNPITSKDISLFDNGVEQTIKNFAPDLSPARIVLLVDNSLTIRADVEKLEAATREFAYEIYDGDKLLIVGYDSNAEIVSDWTDDAKKIETELKSFRKKGDPHLFDAIMAVAGGIFLFLTAQKGTFVGVSDAPRISSNAKNQKIIFVAASLYSV